ncbi:uncharacterized protein MCYG_03087 [Microsporum canis CBS 113480]|uniref:Uncharacterized protein n=1 Tax=Arthroderma otae (strain ATCC MYA-4605 / CBS 113480) TaxID=554155 RepID=C5FKP6_ARTOC|nr:uncharacterized protein MCYG_03087 [Microsporum canis CBS 113480]EEQ30268.1 predicted protein [Microsporum canis CBS 113480]
MQQRDGRYLGRVVYECVCVYVSVRSEKCKPLISEKPAEHDIMSASSMGRKKKLCLATVDRPGWRMFFFRPHSQVALPKTYDLDGRRDGRRGRRTTQGLIWVTLPSL